MNEKAKLTQQKIECEQCIHAAWLWHYSDASYLARNSAVGEPITTALRDVRAQGSQLPRLSKIREHGQRCARQSPRHSKGRRANSKGSQTCASTCKPITKALRDVRAQASQLSRLSDMCNTSNKHREGAVFNVLATKAQGGCGGRYTAKYQGEDLPQVVSQCP
jgi:hypothetical protein